MKKIYAGDMVRVKNLHHRFRIAPECHEKYFKERYLNRLFVVDAVWDDEHVMLQTPFEEDIIAMTWHMDELELVAEREKVEHEYNVGDRVLIKNPKNKSMLGKSFRIDDKSVSRFQTTEGQDVYIYHLGGVAGYFLPYELVDAPSHMFESIASSTCDIESSVEALNELLRLSKNLYSKERMGILDGIMLAECLDGIESATRDIRKYIPRSLCEL